MMIYAIDLAVQKIKIASLFMAVTLFLLLSQVINPQAVMAGDEASIAPKDYTRLLVLDTTYILTGPTRWGVEAWRDFSLYTAGIGAVMLLDKPIYAGVQRNRTGSTSDFSRFIQSFGSYPSFGIIGTFYAVGALLDNTRAKSVAMDAFASSLVSSGVITTTLKVAAGRSRPSQEEGAYQFIPFGGDHSFPSGHTTQAFSLASVIAEHYNERWIDIASYGIATLVGLARVEQEAHFPSDVVAGAVIGTVVGKAIVRYNTGYRSTISVTPGGDNQAMGVYLEIKF